MNHEMTDEQIVEMYWQRDQNAIGRTQEKYGGYCQRIAQNILYDREDAMECVNDTWLRAWNSMPYERPGLLGAFLGAITRNLSLDRYRRAHSAKRGGGQVTYVFDELRDIVSGSDPMAYAQEKELAEAIDRFLAAMERECRVIFVRRYWYMDSVREIAEQFGMSESKVKSMLFRARKRLGTYLEREQLL